MSTIRVEMGGRGFDVTCADGEEEHVQGLARRIDSRLAEAGLGRGGLAESRMLLFAALLLADDLHERDQRAAETPAPPTASAGDAARHAEGLAEIIESLADRVESLGSRLEDRLRRA